MRVEDPLSGWPPTKPLEGEEGYRVKARHFTPKGAEWTDVLTILAIAIVIFAVIWTAMFGMYDTGMAYFGAALVALAFGIVMWTGRYRIFRPFLGKTARIEVRPEVIRLGRLFSYKNYDRRLPHAFDYTIHDRAEWEAEKDADAQQKAAAQKKTGGRARYYRRSYHIVLRYAGQRIDVASVFGKSSAEALLTRLQLLDAMMDAATGEATGPVRPEPAMQYGRRPEAG